MEDCKFKQKKLLKELKSCAGHHTSLISISLRPGDALSQTVQLIKDEMATAINIKSRVNRHSVEEALTMALTQISNYKSTPKNGLFIYCGNCVSNGVLIKKTISIEPFRPVNKKIYRCDSKFHTDEFEKLFDLDTSYGFIIVDGNGYLLTILRGNDITYLEKYEVNLPKKHNKGGQSALRFARLRLESRTNYVRKITEAINKHYLKENSVLVQAIVIAGNAEFKNIVYESDILDKRIKEKIVSIIDVAYGGKQGLFEAIKLSSNILSNVRYAEEQSNLNRFFTLIANNNEITCYGVKTVLNALFDLEIIDELFLYNESDIKAPNEELLVDFIIENYKNMNIKLNLISDSTSESQQFIRGFGGIGGILRYKHIFEEDFDFESDSTAEDTEISL